MSPSKNYTTPKQLRNLEKADEREPPVAFEGEAEAFG